MQRKALLGEDGPLLALQGVPLGVLLRLLQEGADEPLRVPAAAGAAETRGGERLGDGAARHGARELQVGVVEERGPHHVHDDPPDRQLRRAQFGDAVRGLLDGHLLQQRHQVHRRLRRLEDTHHGLCLIVYRADLGEPRDLVVHVQEARDPPGGRRVHDHVVIGELSALVLPAHGLARLAGEEHVPDAGRDGGREVDGAELLQGPSGAPQFVEHLEVVQKGQFGIYGEGVHLPAARSDGDLPLLVGQRFCLEELRDALSALDLHEEGALALCGEGEREGRGYRGLAGTALAADDLEPAHVFEPNQSTAGVRRRLWTTCARGPPRQRLQSAT